MEPAWPVLIVIPQSLMIFLHAIGRQEYGCRLGSTFICHSVLVSPGPSKIFIDTSHTFLTEAYQVRIVHLHEVF